MSAVSGEDMQDRTDRAILTPWLKFLWESYRQCLDLLRNNQSVEKLYHEVAQNGMLVFVHVLRLGCQLIWLETVLLARLTSVPSMSRARLAK